MFSYERGTPVPLVPAHAAFYLLMNLRRPKHTRVLEGFAKSQSPPRPLGVDFCRPLPKSVPQTANPSSSLALEKNTSKTFHLTPDRLTACLRDKSITAWNNPPL